MSSSEGEKTDLDKTLSGERIDSGTSLIPTASASGSLDLSDILTAINRPDVSDLKVSGMSYDQYYMDQSGLYDDLRQEMRTIQSLANPHGYLYERAKRLQTFYTQVAAEIENDVKRYMNLQFSRKISEDLAYKNAKMKIQHIRTVVDEQYPIHANKLAKSELKEIQNDEQEQAKRILGKATSKVL